MTAPTDRLAAALADRYRIERELGQGGMATVYLAEDLKHHRRVAIKVLKPELAAVIGAERFLAEIRTTANLQHPHILPLHDSGEVERYLFYVMPFVEGESLRDRLQREKQLPVHEALRIASEVAGALDYAHRHGVIHRDIKPENILLHDGSALVADFGIALAASRAGGGRMTETGLSLGTPHYMSPEQAMGEREIGPASDVYALGAVTYEMLVGEPPFTGPTVQSIVARVLTETPRALVSARRTIPSHVESAVLTALEKLPADRFGSAAEFAAALRSDVPGHRNATTRDERVLALPSARLALRGRVVGAAVILVLGVVALVGWLRAHRSETAPALVSYLPPPPGLDFGGGARFAALSPDGARLAFVGFADDGSSQLWVWNLSSLRPTPLEGTTGAEWPFWSPDGGAIGFFGEGWLKRVAANGGGAVRLCQTNAFRGGSWSSGGLVVFATSAALMRVDASGGACRQVLANDSARHMFQPTALPDGRRFVVGMSLSSSVGSHSDALYIVDATTGTLRRLGGGQFPTYVAPGYLLFESFKENSATLLAQRFDARRGALLGAPVVVADSVWEPSGILSYTVSANGLLVFRRGVPDSYDLLTDRTGRALDTLRRTGTWTHAFARRHDWLAMAGTGLWLVDLGRQTISALGSGSVPSPVWAPGDTAVAHSDDCGIAVTRIADGQRRRLIEGNRAVGFETGCLHPTAWSPDGRELVITIGRGDTLVASHIWRYRFADSSLTLLVGGQDNSMHGTISPDGRWLAYVSDATGAHEIYVAPYGGGLRGHRVSVRGGFRPRWRGDGRELLYYAPSGRIMSVAVRDGAEFTSDAPVPLFAFRSVAADLWLASPFDVSPDGQRFALHPPSATPGDPLVMMVNWPRLVGLEP